jgi:hypothetical protein
MPAMCSRRNRPGLAWSVLALLAVALPLGQRLSTRRELARRLDQVALVDPSGSFSVDLAIAPSGPLLASWHTVGGCGSGATTGAGGGVKWIGPATSGGFFNVMTQATYMGINAATRQEHHLYVNSLITKDLSEKWNVGLSVPLVYKYLRDPYGLNIDLSNSGLGDIYLQATRRLGAINDTLLTAALGLPTGKYDQLYKNTPLRQHQQLGFGRVAASVTLDHVMDELWGMMVVGASGAWRGGENSLSNYRAPSGSAYGYVGYYLGKLVPSVGLSLTGLPAHDRDRSQDEATGLFIAAPSVALEWGTDWIAFMAGASFPYQYDGITKNSEGGVRTPWGWAPWSASLAISIAPF